MSTTKLLLVGPAILAVDLLVLSIPVVLGASPDVIALVCAALVIAGGGFAGARGDRIPGPHSGA